MVFAVCERNALPLQAVYPLPETVGTRLAPFDTYNSRFSWSTESGKIKFTSGVDYRSSFLTVVDMMTIYPQSWEVFLILQYGTVWGFLRSRQLVNIIRNVVNYPLNYFIYNTTRNAVTSTLAHKDLKSWIKLVLLCATQLLKSDTDDWLRLWITLG